MTVSERPCNEHEGGVCLISSQSEDTLFTPSAIGMTYDEHSNRGKERLTFHKPLKMTLMERKNSTQKLAETIHSLLGLKSHLTSTWIRSVCGIMRTLPSPRSSDRIGLKISDTEKENNTSDTDLSIVIPKIGDELAELHDCIKRLNVRRRQVLNEYLDMKGNIRVFCRVRPMNVTEKIGCARPVVATDSSTVFLKVASGKNKSYSFDKVFHPSSSQGEVFSEVEPLIKSALDGYNACIFAYGQTGTGKTFTMEGTPDFPGIVPRSVEALFKHALESNCTHLFTFSMLEIYLGNLKDLLVPQPKQPTDLRPPCLSVQMDARGGIEVENLVAIPVSDYNQALRLYKLGSRFRSTASTNSNLTSSRSHCMIRLKITCYNAPERQRESNKVWLVDLGGSERVLKTKAWGKRLEEGKAINLSLSALGDVINALQRKKPHIPFRNSKLTQVLKDSLGEDSKTLMLVHVSPKEEDLCETICTLGFAARARSIHLGTEDSIESARKEAAMQSLQETMVKIEDERQRVSRKIKELTRKLENLTGTSPSYNHSTAEEPEFDFGTTKQKAKDVRAAPLSKLPRFMRPTICSQRKSGTEHQISEGKHLGQTKRRRAPSQRAGSVNFPMKSHSDFKSDCSISRASCLVDLDTMCNADTETEYSHDMTECDVKVVVLSEERSFLMTTDGKAQLDHEMVLPSIDSKFYSTEILEVADGLNSQNVISAAGGYKSKRVPAVPLPPKFRHNGQSNAGVSCLERSDAENSPSKGHIDIREYEEESQKSYSASSTSEAEIDELITYSTGFTDAHSETRCRTPSLTNESMICTKHSIDALMILDDDSIDYQRPHDAVCGRLNQNSSDGRVDQLPPMDGVKSETHSLEASPHQEHREYCFSLVGSLIDQEKELGVSTSNCNLEPDNYNASFGWTRGDTKRAGLFEKSAAGRQHDMLRLKHQRTLFKDNAGHNNVDNGLKLIAAEGYTQNTGMFHLLQEKFWNLYFTALLGLGLQNLGFEHEFFDGLTL
ncbi:kinesin-like protein KIN-14T isoform X3 [Rhodamnia argentea]|uniref:Kinesin-like protein KIN-14T isoform X3 n=1 Tax=Rhodamnia argentea TaxID=178133 RepID=A0ABM3HK35_9MYRT|nr:kinesin-like protein KIN-14T isoform X3 [Rhodamnia argentea]